MFLENKYKVWYFNIVQKARSRNASSLLHIENHHIIPKSLGGSNHKVNLVSLTPREHFICHYLLTKFTVGNDKRKMCFALSSFHRNNKDQKRVLNSWEYEKLRLISKKIAIELLSNRIFPLGENHHRFGKAHTDISKEIIRNSKQMGYWNTPWGKFNFISDAIKFAKQNNIFPRLNDNDTLKKYCKENSKTIRGTRSNKEWIGFSPVQLGFSYEEY